MVEIQIIFDGIAQWITFNHGKILYLRKKLFQGRAGDPDLPAHVHQRPRGAGKMTTLRIKNAFKRYPNGAEAVKGVSVDVGVRVGLGVKVGVNVGIGVRVGIDVDTETTGDGSPCKVFAPLTTIKPKKSLSVTGCT